MTITYSYSVANATMGGFGKLLLRWKGSIYKLMYREMLIFIGLYTILSMIYRWCLTPVQKRIFEKIALYCHTYTDLIPLSFVFGFYVALIVGRWWQQYNAIPWPDTLMLKVTSYVVGDDERGQMMRRTMMRYANLMLVLTLQGTSISVKKRFPTLDHLVEAGLMTKEDLRMMDSIPNAHGKWWFPSIWFCTLAVRARKENRIRDDYFLDRIIRDLDDFRGKCGLLFAYDWISVPLVYTQVVTLALYTFFLATLMGRQYLDPHQNYPGRDVDLYIPLFTILQFFFYMGWLKVAEQLINPFGEDDDDFEMNWIIDRNMQASYMACDAMFNKLPKLQKDIYWGDIEFSVPYTKGITQMKGEPFIGSTMNLDIPPEDMGFVPMDTILEADTNEDEYDDRSSVSSDSARSGPNPEENGLLLNKEHKHKGKKKFLLNQRDKQVMRNLDVLKKVDVFKDLEKIKMVADLMMNKKHSSENRNSIPDSRLASVTSLLHSYHQNRKHDINANNIAHVNKVDEDIGDHKLDPKDRTQSRTSSAKKKSSNSSFWGGSVKSLRTGSVVTIGGRKESVLNGSRGSRDIMQTISKVFHHHNSNPPLPTSASNYHDDNPRRHKFAHSSKHRNITTSALQTRNNSFSADGAQINDSKENLNETEDYSKRRERQQQRRLNEAMKEMEAAVEKAKTEALDLSHQSGKIGMDGKLLSSAPINIPKNTIINKAKIINAAAKKYPKSSKDSSTIQSKPIKRLSEPLNVIPERPATPGDNTLQSHQNSRENTLINDKQKQQEKEEIVSNMNLAMKAERNFKLPFRGLIINSSGGKPAKSSSGTTKPGLDRAGNDDGANAKNKAESGDRDLGLNGKDEFVPREISAQRNNEENDTFSLADDDDDDEDGMPVDDFEEEDMEDEPENDDEEGEEEERDDDLLAAEDDDKQEGSRQPKGLGRRYVRNSFDPRKNNALLNRRNHLLISQEAVSSPNPAHDSFTPNSYYSKPPSGIDMSSENDANQSYSHEPSLSLYPLMMVGSCPPSYHILSAKGDRESLLPCFEVVDKTVTETDHPVVENIELSQKLYPQINNAQLDDVEGSEEFGDIEQENNLKVEEEDPYPSNQDTLTSLAGVEAMPLFTRKRSCPSFQLRAVDSKDVILERKGSKGGASQRQQRLSKIFSPASVFGINNKNRNNVMDLESGLLPSRHEIPYSSPSHSSSHHHLSRQFTNISRVISPSSLNLSHDNNNYNRQENNTVTPCRNRRYSSPSKIQMAGQESTDVQNNTSQDTSDHWWEEKENPELYIIQDDFSSSPFSNANEFPAVSYNEITSMAQEESKKDVRSRSRNRFSLSRASACDGDEGFPRALTRDLSVHFEPTPHDNIKMDLSGGVIRRRIGQRIGQFFTRNNKYARERDRDRVSFRRRQRDAKATNEYNIVDNMNNHLSSNLVIPKTPGPEEFNAYNTTQNNECHVDFNNNVCERVAKIDAESPHPVLFRPDFDNDRSPIHPLLDITDNQVSNKVMPTLPPLAFQQLPCTNNDDGGDPPHDNHSNQVLQPTTTTDASSIIPSILNDSKDSLESQSSNDTINSLSALIHETSLTNHSIPTSS